MHLKVDHITKKFKQKTAVNDISFDLNDGKMLGFLGRNGAGKTTTFRMILGLTKPTEGQITYNNQKLNQSHYNEIGYLPEERGLHPKLTVEEELRYLATLKGMNGKDFNKAFNYWLERFDIVENKDKKIQSLSKGNQQKIQLMASIIHNPKLLILDEPFSGLDPVNVELLKSAVKDLNRQGASIIFSSHRMEHVEELCDDVVILKDGNAVVSGPIQDVKAEFKNKKLLIEADFDLSPIQAIEGVVQMSHDKDVTTITIANEAVAHDVYKWVVAQGFVKRFQVAEPSMNEIFIAKVGERNV